MRSGQDITFSGPVSRRTIENAQSLVDIWSMWVPEKYAPISVSAQDFIEDSSPRIGSALLFSGGVDSTFGLVSEKVKQDIRIAVTAHGLDYDSRKNDQFDQLIQRTQALLDKYVVEHVIVETNAGRIVGDLGLTHAFLLASCLFLGGAGSEKGACRLTL